VTKIIFILLYIIFELYAFGFFRLDDYDHHGGDDEIGTGTWLIRGGYWPKKDADALETEILIYLDKDGGLPKIDNEDEIVQEAFDAWNNVEDANVKLVIGGKISRSDLTPNTQFIYYDKDGSVMRDQGIDDSGLNSILGFAFPYTDSNTDSGMYTSSIIVLNGTLISSEEELKITLIHEMGHFLGLDHTYYSDDSIPTMYSENVSSSNQSTLKQDDKAGVSTVYPEKSFYKDLGAILGNVTFYDGTSVFGAQVIAIDANSTTINDNAVSSITGFPLCFSSTYYTNDVGEYIIPGLIPGNYYVKVESFPLIGKNGFQIEDELLFPTGSGIGGYDFGYFDAGFNSIYYNNTKNLEDATKISVVANYITTDVDFTIGSANTLQIGSYFRHNDLSSDAYNKIKYKILIGSKTSTTTIIKEIESDSDKFFMELDLTDYASYLPPSPSMPWYLEIYNMLGKKISDGDRGTTGILNLFAINYEGKTYSMNSYFATIDGDSTYVIDGKTRSDLTDRNLSFNPNCNPETKSGTKEEGGNEYVGSTGGTSSNNDPNENPEVTTETEEDSGCVLGTTKEFNSNIFIILFFTLFLLIIKRKGKDVF
jgi:hypothetical protein